MLVLAMEFSRGARCRPWNRRPDEVRERSTSADACRLHGSSDKDIVAPSKRNSEGPTTAQARYTGPARAAPPKGNESDAAAAENARAPNNQ
jgi:hypothetical protein